MSERNTDNNQNGDWNCNICEDTGYYGDNSPGQYGNSEYVKCRCNIFANQGLEIDEIRATSEPITFEPTIKGDIVMNAEDVLKNNVSVFDWIREVTKEGTEGRITVDEDQLKAIMKEYAKAKCEELLDMGDVKMRHVPEPELREIALRLLDKYKTSEREVIHQFSGNISQDLNLLEEEVSRYRQAIEEIAENDNKMIKQCISGRKEKYEKISRRLLLSESSTDELEDALHMYGSYIDVLSDLNEFL